MFFLRGVAPAHRIPLLKVATPLTPPKNQYKTPTKGRLRRGRIYPETKATIKHLTRTPTIPEYRTTRSGGARGPRFWPIPGVRAGMSNVFIIRRPSACVGGLEPSAFG